MEFKVVRFKDVLNPGKRLKISRIFVNKRNGQMTIVLPKRKMKSVPSKVEVTYW